ncbi:5-oxoprolinase subunit B family protein [Thioclava indica]|uniref:5-oxoprolinase subunit B family protein n=1 Tax=Thioclava indica TaxID=1353528 RepID=UPI00068DDCA4|nr:carboxyltransferase domain-containing protein [Thioclava indica]
MSVEYALLPPSAGPQDVQILPLGQDGILVRFALRAEPWATSAAQAFYDTARAAPLPHLHEIVPSLTSVLFRFDATKTTRAECARQIAELLSGRDWHTAMPQPATRIWRIPAAFGGEHGPDLEAASKLAGLSPEAAIEMITTTPLRVLAIGFAPGQPYLGLLPKPWDLPRMQSLNPQVPKGAIAVAVRQLVLFSNASPTGWRQIARTAFAPFRPDAEPAVPLRAGDALQLVPVSGDDLTGLLASGDPAGGAICETRE